eukprot:jgi/Tetstr1/442213/TSEL_030360.t1
MFGVAGVPPAGVPTSGALAGSNSTCRRSQHQRNRAPDSALPPTRGPGRCCASQSPRLGGAAQSQNEAEEASERMQYGYAVNSFDLLDSQSEIELSAERVMTTFRWPAALGGEEVGLIGSFSNWENAMPLGKSSETGDFVRTLPLTPGTYQYKYLVDGKWMCSPCDVNTKNALGEFNNHCLVSPSHTFTWEKAWGGEEVFMTGDFVAWAELIPMKYDDTRGQFTATMSLPPGIHSVQYLVDGNWMLSPMDPIVADEDGHNCNKVLVKKPEAFHIFYATGWKQADLMVRGADGSWRQLPMHTAESRSSPAGGIWYTVTIPSTPSHQLDFYISNGEEGADARRDTPFGAECYTCPAPGGYKLVNGRLIPFKRALEPPMMLVSDLDGTMVGDTAEFDFYTDAFRVYWEDNAALANSTLVYNTGRSVGAVMGLLDEKQGKLAMPDVLITAVGTKVWLLDEVRSNATGKKWREDEVWAARLDEGWDLEKARAVGEEAVGRFNGQCYWLDKGTEHPHRVAFSVETTVLPDAVAFLRQRLEEAGVQVRIITSGNGEWRYVDCVAIRAGKLEALEYVRTLYGVPKTRCVAAGDSGNDILMLEGENRALIVGNAQPELQDWLLRQPQTDRIVYTTAPGAAGILEGLGRLGLY